MNFDLDDIHRIRVENAERRAKMTPEEARADFDRSVAEALRTMAEIDAKKVIAEYRFATAQ